MKKNKSSAKRKREKRIIARIGIMNYLELTCGIDKETFNEEFYAEAKKSEDKGKGIVDLLPPKRRWWSLGGLL